MCKLDFIVDNVFLNESLLLKNMPDIREVDVRLGARIRVRNHRRAQDLITETHSTAERKTEGKKVRVTLQ